MVCSRISTLGSANHPLHHATAHGMFDFLTHRTPANRHLHRWSVSKLDELVASHLRLCSRRSHLSDNLCVLARFDWAGIYLTPCHLRAKCSDHCLDEGGGRARVVVLAMLTSAMLFSA